MPDQAGRHATHGLRVRWLLSRWDHHVHAFTENKIGEVVAEAVCEHSALTRRLLDEDGPRCMGCLLLHGDELASRHGEANRWAM